MATDTDLQPVAEEVTVLLSGQVTGPTVLEKRRNLAAENNQISFTSITQGEIPTSARLLAETFAMKVVARQAQSFQGTIQFHFHFYGWTVFDKVFRSWRYSYIFTIEIDGAFPPFHPIVGQFGICSVCHFKQITVTATGICYMVRANFISRQLVIVTRNLTPSTNTWKGCLVPAPSQINCAGKCCDLNLEEKCVDDKCKVHTPTPTPTHSSTPTHTSSPTPSSVSRQLIRLGEGDDCEGSKAVDDKEWFTM